ncbi:hypothetical protein GBA52_010003 [Prunus armeniaca]|nr:hypothetical protein GBA52_010003 [Prunus armeniaca]
MINTNTLTTKNNLQIRRGSTYQTPKELMHLLQRQNYSKLNKTYEETPEFKCCHVKPLRPKLLYLLPHPLKELKC